MLSLEQTLRACTPFLPEDFRAAHARLFEDEHLAHLAERLLRFREQGVPRERPLPHFAAECTPGLSEPWAFFEPVVNQWQTAADGATTPLLQQFAAALVAAGLKNLLLLLGQR